MKHSELYTTYDKPHCWQFDIRKQNIEQDLKDAKITIDEAVNLRTKDFVFEHVSKDEKDKCDEIIKFIKRHEWLGNMPNRPTHRFTARYNGILAGVVIMAVPNTVSKLIGAETFKYEKLISRGACISWSPKNLGSWIVSRSINWMIHNTQFRVFTAYSDPEARELGSIYQACSFIYLGQSSGTNIQYLDPDNENMGWFSERHLRHKSMYKRYAEEVGISAIEWKKYMRKYSPNWAIIPDEVKQKIKQQLEIYKLRCKMRTTKAKHKYVYIHGVTKSETKKLMRLFNANSKSFPYPKVRGT